MFICKTQDLGIINPLISAAHNKVYQIPILLMIGWRGAPKLKDEPQHLAKGQITKQIIKCGIKFCVLNTVRFIKIKKINKLFKKIKGLLHVL